MGSQLDVSFFFSSPFISAENPDNAAMLETMIQRAKDLTAKECLGMVRCISTALSLVNAAEVQHRLRSIKRHERESGNVFPGPLYHTEDSVKGSIHALLQQGQATAEEIWKQLSTQKVERTSLCIASELFDIVLMFLDSYLCYYCCRENLQLF